MRPSLATPALTPTPLRKAYHLGNCPVCGERFDMRDLAQAPAHVHGADIKIGEGPEPHGREGPTQ